jgi:Co/Zn/Cd efflux system component
MAGCCDGDKDCALEALQDRQRGTLRTVLAINVVMFAVIVSAAFYSRSSALLSDSLDNFGDAFTYALSLMPFRDRRRPRQKSLCSKAAHLPCSVFHRCADRVEGDPSDCPDI